MADMQMGGWYNNPAAGGKNMRYWGQYGWTTGSDPTQGGNNNSSSSSSSPNPVDNRLSAPDIAHITSQAYDLLQPYYAQVAKEAKGDFTRAVQILQQDYKSGVRNEKANYALTRSNEMQNLQGSLDKLGITNYQEQEKKVDDLNSRGMATYQQGPNQTPNNVGINLPYAGNYNPASADIKNISTTNPTLDMSGINPMQDLPNESNLGRGGFELNQLYQDQQLRQQAIQRASNSALESAGLKMKQYTNPGSVDFTDPTQAAAAAKDPNLDRSQLGSAETSLLSGQEQATRDYQKTTESLANQRSQQATQIADSLGTLGVKDISADMTNQYQKQQQAAFVNTGI